MGICLEGEDLCDPLEWFGIGGHRREAVAGVLLQS